MKTVAIEEEKGEKKDERREQIINAAIKVFSRLGFHEARVSDIAKEADIAYGLVYHYFESKEQILNSIFERYWSILIKALEHIERNYKSLSAQLEAVADFILRAYLLNPDLVSVVVLEITRSYKFLEEQNIRKFNKTFEIVERMIMREKKRGNLQKGIDPQIASFIIFGGLELVINAFVLSKRLSEYPDLKGRILDPFDEDVFERAKRSLLAVLTSGLIKSKGYKA